jgi:hypothetical protein
MRRSLMIGLITVILALGLMASTALAGSPHFIKSATSVTTNADGSLTVIAKEAGLGGESISVTITGTVACINPGGHGPSAANKHTFAASGTFTVHNGSADISLTTDVPTFKPDCTPPMTIEYSNLVLIDNTNGISLKL